ncbi:MAG: anion transporter [Anaerolineae bacterium]|nr:MAG: anion transporter [Anaerolineae bacterium]
MKPDFWITLGIVTLTYIGVGAGRWPSLRANRTTIALIGVGLLLVTRQVAFEDLGGFLDIDTLVILLSMMILNANLRIAGFFDLAAHALIRRARTPRQLLLWLLAASGLLSAFFLNDTICLMFTPLVVDLLLALRRNPVPYLIGLAAAANIGSVATITGNPQNMIIGIASGIPYLEFLAALAPIAILGLGVAWVVLVRLYPAEFTAGTLDPPDMAPPKVLPSRLWKSLAVSAGLLVAFLLGAPVAEAAFLAACVLLLTRRVHPESVFREFNWELLLFFAALFVVTGSLEANGVAERLFAVLRLGPETGLWPFAGLTALFSNLVSNVPAVLLLRPVIPNLANPAGGWLALAAASTLAGNLTLLGSVANLIVAELSAHRKVTLGFGEYLRAGIPITLATLVIAVLWLGRYW